MSTTTARRITALERSQEWHDAHTEMERVLRWARAVGMCDETRADAICTELRAFVPLEAFVKGTWTPLAKSPEDTAAADTI
ncbi:MAG TPA: hypothetical protein VGW38_24130 [Chloroflexota bacterium]|nr:hypothetical protein [Chloroflexota bacterium]